MQIFEDYDEALAAKTDELSLCGTYRGETPVYFLIPAGATMDQGRDAAFQVQHGRPITNYELSLLKVAEQINQQVPA